MGKCFRWSRAFALTWLGLLASVSPLHAQDRLPSLSSDGAGDVSATRTRLPLTAHVYTSQVQLGSVQWVMSLAVALGLEYPRWQRGALSLFPAWKIGFEHHAHLHQRWYAGVGLGARLELHALFALQLRLGASGARIDSLWSPFHFDAGAGSWSSGESSSRWLWLFDGAATLWAKLDERFDVGLDYGLGVLYPFASANDIPVLPLTRLGIQARWVYEI